VELSSVIFKFLWGGDFKKSCRQNFKEREREREREIEREREREIIFKSVSSLFGKARRDEMVLRGQGCFSKYSSLKNLHLKKIEFSNCFYGILFFSNNQPNQPNITRGLQ
jgi:hypothetical protein